MNVHVPPHHALAERLKRELEGDVLFDPASRGRYATDASIYQIEPVGVVVPKTPADVEAAHQIARDAGVSLLPRGGGTSQSGQTVGRSLVIDYSKHVNRLLETDRDAATCLVEPGIVLDELNRQLKSTGLWFPVDVSTSSRATIGGMTGNNSCGTRSIRYGIMRDNVLAIDALLADGTKAHFGEVPADFTKINAPDAARDLFRDLLRLGERDAEHIRQAFPEVSRRVGGYLIDGLLPPAPSAEHFASGAAGEPALSVAHSATGAAGYRPRNLATILCGSEGTLALSERIRLKLSPQPRNKALGICHFASFRKAMEAAQHIVKLGPVAVELVDRTLIELARDIAMFRPVMERHVRGKPDALLLVEFAEDDQAENLRRVDRLAELMGDLGHPNAVVKVADAAEQRAVWEVRAAGLNIMMSMKTEGKPVSFIEDCAVPLEHLADYTERLTEVFAKHGTTGTWYAHASVGCLHVRPVLNLKLEHDVKTMRAIAEAAFEMVREYKGAHSGEHGDGLVRSEFHESMYGRKTVQLFEAIKDRFDPNGLMNPGKIVRSPRMDDRSLMRFAPGYGVHDLETVLDWSAWPGAGGGFQGAVEMCNNNGECRKLAGGAMCPSYRVTRDERDVTRGRANTLRLAMSGQIGADGLASAEVQEALALCVSCKACRRECPTGVDMAKMKIEALAARNRARQGWLPPGERLVAYLPRYAGVASKLALLANLRNRWPALARLMERATGFSAKRRLPEWKWRRFGTGSTSARQGTARPERKGDAESARIVALLADTFNGTFEPENLEATIEVLERLGYRVQVIAAKEGGRPVCCGRTFLAAGLVDEARKEARRLLEAVRPHLEAGHRVVGIEPSCLLTLRDEMQAMGLGAEVEKLAGQAVMLEEFLVAEVKAGGIAKGALGRLETTVHLHTHCHQKAFGVAGAVEQALRLIDGMTVKPIESGCCGMAGSFGYQAATHDVSLAMGELALFPAVRAASKDHVIAADGFSCRHQIADGAQREARHVALILRDALRARDDSASRRG
ncbi:MAG: FAD-linked oxidase C-terminal domain-containing protein [Hyphomicrobiaceae bacterium]